MILFGALHLSLIAATALIAILLAWACRERRVSARAARLSIGIGLIVNELIWWRYRYSHEGIHVANLPLQLCDATLWMSAIACLTLAPRAVEFAYFAGLAGAGMAILTPDLWSPWPSYPAVYFFVAHGGIVIAVVALVFGRIAPLREGAVWRAFTMLVAYACAVGAVNAITGANYMYLRQKPRGASLLDQLGPWPWYLIPAAAVSLAFFWLLWLPARGAAATAKKSAAIAG
jgi:hypothetical integral membrane protein (TIGR02206 family)